MSDRNEEPDAIMEEPDVIMNVPVRRVRHKTTSKKPDKVIHEADRAGGFKPTKAWAKKCYVMADGQYPIPNNIHRIMCFYRRDEDAVNAEVPGSYIGPYHWSTGDDPEDRKDETERRGWRE